MELEPALIVFSLLISSCVDDDDDDDDDGADADADEEEVSSIVLDISSIRF